MSKPVILFAAVLILVVGGIIWRINESSSAPELPFESKIKPPQASPLCPWREPEADLELFFPSATRYEIETHILSGLRLELAERLGRAPTGDENALQLHRVYHEQSPLGTVLTRRVKGTYGAIELVLAVANDERLCGLRLQRLREPATVESALQDPEWRGSFKGKGSDNSWKIGHDIPEVPAEARASAEAIVDGVRSLLILLAAADHPRSRVPVAAPHH